MKDFQNRSSPSFQFPLLNLDPSFCNEPRHPFVRDLQAFWMKPSSCPSWAAIREDVKDSGCCCCCPEQKCSWVLPQLNPIPLPVPWKNQSLKSTRGQISVLHPDTFIILGCISPVAPQASAWHHQAGVALSYTTQKRISTTVNTWILCCLCCFPLLPSSCICAFYTPVVWGVLLKRAESQDLESPGTWRWQNSHSELKEHLMSKSINRFAN